MSSQPVQPSPQLQHAQQLFNSLSRSRKIVLIAAVVGLVFSFFPWYGVSASFGGYSNSWSENGWHNWGLVATLLFIVAGAWILLPLAGVSLRGVLAALPPVVTEARVMMGIGGVAALAVILFMFTEVRNVSGPGISAGPSVGAYVGLLCAIAIAAGGFLLQHEPETA